MINTAPTTSGPCESCAVDARLEGAGDSPADTGDSRSVADLLNGIRANNRTLLQQSERIEELQSVLSCILYLTGKVRNLELENDC